MNKAYEIKKRMVLAKITNWEQKENIMENRKNVKETTIYIESDMTQKERSTQRQLRPLAESETKKGNKAIMGYRKIIMNDTSSR